MRILQERWRKAINAATSPTFPDDSTLVFYPHGNLALASDLTGMEHKMSTQSFGTLLDTVIDKWESGEYTPLFVSEGISPKKLAAIRSSSYLGTVYESVIPSLRGTLVIYGWSMGKEDDHILKALKRSKIKEIAVSVYKPARKTEQKAQQMLNQIKKFMGSKTNVYFFDSESPGCWEKPPAGSS